MERKSFDMKKKITHLFLFYSKEKETQTKTFKKDLISKLRIKEMNRVNKKNGLIDFELIILGGKKNEFIFHINTKLNCARVI
jgi:hypothetical protein